MPAITAYEQIRANNLKTAFLVFMLPVVLCLVFYGICFILFSAENESFESVLPLINQVVSAAFPVIVLISALWIWCVCSNGHKMIMAFADAKPLSVFDKESKDVRRLVENTALMAGLPTPKIYIIEDESLNAFATGYSPKKACIGLTRGIINKLSPDELQGVIAHEMAHIRNRDIRLNLILLAGFGIFGLIAENMFRASPNRSSHRAQSSKDNQLIIILWAFILTCYVFHFFLKPFFLLAISRTREYAADATGALITHQPTALASALAKIAVDPRVEVLDNHKEMAFACIETPLQSSAFSLTSTHPSIKDRIYRLKLMAGEALIK